MYASDAGAETEAETEAEKIDEGIFAHKRLAI